MFLSNGIPNSTAPSLTFWLTGERSGVEPSAQSSVEELQLYLRPVQITGSLGVASLSNSQVSLRHSPERATLIGPAQSCNGSPVTLAETSSIFWVDRNCVGLTM